MREKFLNKKIPTLIGLLIITLGIFGTSFLVQNLRPLITRATVDGTPNEIKVSNISSDSFTVSWETQDNTSGSTLYWVEGEEQTAILDDRDQSSAAGLYRTHYMSIKSLKPGTRYFFAIISGETTFDNNGVPYEVTTANLLTGPDRELKAGGAVVLDYGSPSKDSVVFLQTSSSQLLSTTVSQDGKWDIENAIRTADLKSYYEVTPQEILNVLITDGGKSSTIAVLLQAAGNEIPTITLGQDYDFTAQDSEASPSAKAASLFKNIPPLDETTDRPTVITPKDGEKFVDSKPRFSGTAAKNSTVKIKIESPNLQEATIKADSNGNWSYRPTQPLSPGEHTITVGLQEASGVQRILTRKFQVFAAGTQIDEPATPSATPTVKPSPTPTATPTATPTVTSTEPPIPTKAPGPIPVTGESLPLIMLGAIGVITFLAGLALLF